MPAVALISESMIAEAIRPEALIDAVEAAFRERGHGIAAPAGVMGVEVDRGGFHLKAAARSATRGVFAAKLNGNFPGNATANGMPTIQGLVIVADVATGAPLAVMESSSLTRLRTAAATAVAVRHLARSNANHIDLDSAPHRGTGLTSHRSAQLTVIGCGEQAFDQIRFVHAVRPLRRVTLFDTRLAVARTLAMRIEAELGIEAEVAEQLAAACEDSAIIITCTTSRTPFLESAMVPAGALVAAVGADNPHKAELSATLMASAKVVTDATVQCATIGDLRHAIATGAMRVEDVHAELGEIVASVRPGRESDVERIVFDSTGIPIQDAVLAELALAVTSERADLPHFSFRT